MASTTSPDTILEANEEEAEHPGADLQPPTPNPPPPVHVYTPHSEAAVADDDAASSSSLEATELRSIRPSNVLRQNRSARSSPGLVRRRPSSELTTHTAPDEAPAHEVWRCRLKRQPKRRRWHDGIRRWWGRNVRMTVPVEGRRDHLALERTYLGYLRTSIALSMVGVVIAQLFRLQHSPTPDLVLGYYVLGVPLGSCFIIAAILVAALGAFRFWRQQNALARGKVLVGGWEVYAIMIGSILLAVTLFVFSVAVDVRKEDDR